ncbi:hypothetical protein GJ699_14360 [Duganella sp. FT80W]|uniref:RiboL-PSP-HEPN domain-containing protein n=1 Tax=Duganella guangzhouensis TaxID=2666084 RepID=A0A6I2KYE8_9BURK|nr:hypothetical protein [Duganella guangzhouensis]MRW91175.1 hypothetical protein [Duganella guangzhouensis]
MGWNDRLEEWDRTNLPPEALDNESAILEIDNTWLSSATPAQQREALKAWFLARYCDPANETPYISAEGGYIFIHGGPYDPQEELGHRFYGVADDEAIEEVVSEMYMQVGDRWAPIHWDRDFEDYDEDFGVVVDEPDTPRLALERRLNQITELLSLDGPSTAMALARMFAFSGTITALESFLWETMTYVVENDEDALEKIVTKIDHFSKQNLTLGEIFIKQKGLKDFVKAYLQDTVWHKWEKVAPMIVHGLQISPPSFKPFIEPVKKRHDIVHRSGQTKDGAPITVDAEEIANLMAEVRNFANSLNAKMAERFFKGESGSEVAAPVQITNGSN